METITYARALNRKFETCSANEYQAICLKNKNCNEITPDDRKMKAYFDIDLKPSHCYETQEYVDCIAELIDFAKDYIRDYLTAIKPNWCVLESSSASYVTREGGTSWIISGHIIVSNYVASKKKLLSLVKQINIAINNELNDKNITRIKLTHWIIGLKKNSEGKYAHEFFDESVYDTKRKFRSAHCHKVWIKTKKDTPFKDERSMRLVEGTFEQSVISAFYDEETVEIMDDADVEQDDTDKESVKSVENTVEKKIIDGNDIEKLLEIIGDTLCGDGKQSEWTKVAQAIKNETKEEGLTYFVTWTHKYGTENKKKECITHYTKYIKYTPKSDKKRLSIGSLHYWAKEANAKLYADVFSHSKPSFIEEDNSFEGVASVFERNHCKIVNKSFFVKHTPSDIVVMSKTALITAYENMVYQKIVKDEIVECNFINDWLRNNKQQLKYDDIGCYPDASKCPSNVFNAWRPFAMELVTEYKPNLEALKIIRDHIKILCNHDTTVATYMEAWIAQMIQFPAVKSNCPTLISKEGAGKGTLLKLLSLMIGDDKYFETPTPSRDVWGNFNGRMVNAFLVNLDELTRKESLECEGKIKALITNPHLTINEKGVKQYGIISYHRFFGTTNHEDPLKTSKDDRRNWIVRSSDELLGNVEYFTKMNEYLADVNVLKTCYEHFKSIPGMKDFNKLPIPVTEYQQDMKEMNMSPIESWLKSFTLEHYYDKTNPELLGKEQYDLFNEWCRKCNIDYKVTLPAFAVRLKRLKIIGIEQGKHTNKGNTNIFEIETLRLYFKLNLEQVVQNTEETADEDVPDK
jgi:hypothetical protein